MVSGWVRFLGLVVFWDWRRWGMWGWVGVNPLLPFLWRFYLGPVCVARVTLGAPRKLSRQERRYLLRQVEKRKKALLRRHGR